MPMFKDRYVIDTNVLIAASAVHAVAHGNRLAPQREVTPCDPALQRKVCRWLAGFENSASRLVLDIAGGINAEYHNKLEFNDYGIQVVMNKINRGQVDLVTVEYDENGDGIVPQPLDDVVKDLADRKMLAAALEALNLPGSSAIAYAGDTDWLDWELELIKTGLVLEPIIESWARAKHEAKQHRRHLGKRHD